MPGDRVRTLLAAPLWHDRGRVQRSDSRALIDGQQRQLERQRDIALSWPWGVGLAIPGVVLYSIGFAWGPKPIDWSISAALVGVFLFVYIAIVIYGKALAGRWQSEIDELRKLRN